MKKNMNNNQYLCKAKRTFNGDWITGCLLVFDDEYRIATSCLQSTFEDEPDAVLEVCTYKVDPSTICRCLNISDKNGDFIWENDIVRDKCFKNHFYKIVWDNEEGSWMLQSKSGAMYRVGSLNSNDYEVVGNIFDNPDLFQQCKEDEKSIELEM